jgi:hypothetical protein
MNYYKPLDYKYKKYLNLKEMKKKVNWWLKCENWEKWRGTKLRGCILGPIVIWSSMKSGKKIVLMIKVFF